MDEHYLMAWSVPEIKDNQNLTGKVYGRLTVVCPWGFIQYAKYKVPSSLVKCICGNSKVIANAKLKNGHTKSCGCLLVDNAKEVGALNFNKTTVDFTGQRVGMLTAIKVAEGNKRIRNAVVWVFKCICGNEIERSHDILKTVRSNISCGCSGVSGYLEYSKNKALQKGGYLGVRNNGTKKKPWEASIKQIHLGVFATAEEAARVYDKAALEIHGEQAVLNFEPDEDDV